MRRRVQPPPKATALPAVVLGVDSPIGLAIVRDLGARGVPVHGIGRCADALGLASRHLARAHVRASGGGALLAQLLALGEQLDLACLFVVSEADILLLNRHRAQLGRFRLMFADAERMARVLDKHQTYAAARGVGLTVPRTEQVGSLAEAAALCPSLSFPVVLKWSDPAAVVAQLTLAGLVLHKAHYCHSAAELLAYLSPYQQAGVFPLIQQYCAGYGLGQFILMHGGRAHYLFQHRRLHEWPPEGGVSSLCVSLPSTLHRTLMAQSVALLQALDWDGVAMVEYRHDAVTGASALMEINGRYWGSLPLACHAGASFPWFSYQLLTVGQAGARPDYRAGVRCRFMVPETKRLLRLLFDQRAIADRRLRFARLPALLGWLVDFVRPGTVYQVFRWSDPLPFVRDALQMLRRLGRR